MWREAVLHKEIEDYKKNITCIRHIRNVRMNVNSLGDSRAWFGDLRLVNEAADISVQCTIIYDWDLASNFRRAHPA